MNKVIIIAYVVLALFLCSFFNDKETVVLTHTNYTSTYSKSLKYPLIVEWWETRAKSECANKAPRHDSFAKDPLLPNDTDLGKDYSLGNKALKDKGLKVFDRGHMCPARVNECQGETVQHECFYFSNMAPQYHSLNAGDWLSLETLTYQTSIEKDSVHVWAGSVGSAMKLNSITVPTKCWKVIYVKKTKEWSAYIFNNDTSHPNGIADNKVTVDAIEKLTGFKFNK